MEKVPSSSNKNVAHAAYGTMSGIVTSSIDRFLISFQSSMKGVNEAVSPDALVGFLTSADRFANDCSQRFASMLRELTNKADVRDTSEAVLMRLVRNRCFETLDSVLEEYIAFLAQLSCDLKQPLANLSDSRLRDLADQNAGGWVVQRRFKLPTAAKAAALLKILDYLKCLEQLPDDLLDYGASKLFGAEPEMDLQRSFSASIRAGIEERLMASMRMIDELDVVRQRKWEQQRAAEDAAINAVATMASFRREKAKGGVGALLLGLLCTGPIWWVSMVDAPNLYLGSIAALSGVAALFFFYRSLVLLTKRSNG